jgi:hypothetical protein
MGSSPRPGTSATFSIQNPGSVPALTLVARKKQRRNLIRDAHTPRKKRAKNIGIQLTPKKLCRFLDATQARWHHPAASPEGT